MKDILYKAFILPLSSPDMLRIYLITILGIIGFNGVNLYLAFNYAGLSAGPLIAYFTPRFLGGNVLLFPVLFTLMKKLPGPAFFLIVMGLYIISLTGIVFIIPLISDEILSALLVGFFTTFSSVPFWCVFHAMMAKNTTEANRGNEVAVSQLGIYIGNIIGSLLGGAAIALLSGIGFVIFSYACLFMATMLLLQFLLFARGDWPAHQKRLAGQGPIHAFFKKPRRTLNTVMQGTYSFAAQFFTPVWLKFIGLGGLGIGLFSAAQLILKIILSPIAGHWTNQRRGRETQWGATIKAIGWMPWMFTLSPWCLVWFSLFQSLGGHMFSVGLNSRWYDDQTLEGLAAREMSLGIGRFLTLIVAVPLLYYSVTGFFIFAFLLSILMIGSAIFESKGLKQIP